MSAPTITAALLARDNEDDIASCLESVAWADERLVILDTRSTDRTAAIARTMGARVVPHPFRNFAEQRDVGLRHARGEGYSTDTARAHPSWPRRLSRGDR